MESRPKPLYHT